jgi:hypothetical protein
MPALLKPLSFLMMPRQRVTISLLKLGYAILVSASVCWTTAESRSTFGRLEIAMSGYPDHDFRAGSDVDAGPRLLSVMTNVPDAREARIVAHRSNLNRYCRLLTTTLTDLERDFIHRRITEERKAVERL